MTSEKTPQAPSASGTDYAPKIENAPAYRWLVIGGQGQLGQELTRLLTELGASDLLSIDRDVVDITDPEQTKQTVETWLTGNGTGTPVVVNCAAYTAVDKAEEDEETALQINGDGPRNLAAAIDGRARLVHVSTDYVFPGDASEPYGANDPADPKTAYGRTKNVGDQAVRELAPETGYVVRTAWVYGAYGPNFVKTMTRVAKSNDTLTVVNDQIGSPTWTRHLAQGLAEIAMSDAPAGYYHLTGGGTCSWFDFARAIFEESGLDPERVNPIDSASYPSATPRPAYSVLSSAEWTGAGLTPTPDWRAALHEAFERNGSALS